MARKEKIQHRKDQQKTAWIILLAGGVLLIAAGLYFALSGGALDSGTPVITVDQELIDYGDLHFGEMVSFNLKITNTGDGPLRFTEEPYVEVREGC